MSERKLASIRRIAELRPIEGADKIQLAIIDGWQVVTNKDNGFEVGDLVVYFEIDSVLPERPEFEFLRDRCYVSEKNSIHGAGFRLKTIKLRGQISQGLILPLIPSPHPILKSGWYLEVRGYPSGYPSPFVVNVDNFSVDKYTSLGDKVNRNCNILVHEGDDVTDLLGVKKYEKPLNANLNGVAKGNFPTFIPKTDEERIQNFFKHLKNKYIEHNWEVSVKLDGSSMTVYHRTHPDLVDGEFGVCSRNFDLEESEGNSFWQVARKLNLEEKMRKLGRSIAIQGELIGAGVQGNREGLAGLDFYVFNIWDIEKQKYLSPHDRYELCQMIGLNHTPIIAGMHKFEPIVTVQEILEMADGPSLNHKIREGLVFKSHDDPSVSFKAISNQFLLKGGD